MNKQEHHITFDIIQSKHGCFQYIHTESNRATNATHFPSLHIEKKLKVPEQESLQKLILYFLGGGWEVINSLAEYIYEVMQVQIVHKLNTSLNL